MTTREITQRLPAGRPQLADTADIGPWARSRAAWPPLVPRWPVLVICDGLALGTAAAAAAELTVVPAWLASAYAAMALLALSVSGQHRLRICLRVSGEIPRLVAYAAAAAALVAPWAQPASGLLRLGAVSAGLLVTMRAMSYAALRAGRRRGRMIEHALIVGAGKLGAEIAGSLMEHPELGLLPVGFVDSLRLGERCALPLLGSVPRLSDVVARHHVRKVIVCPTAECDAEVVSALRAGRLLAEVYVVPRMHELAAAIPRSSLDEVWGIPLIRLRPCGPKWPGRLVKRAFDLVVGSALLVALAPLLLALMAALLLCGGRPVLFWQARVTRSGRVTKIAKLRTVTGQGPDTQWTVPPDQCSRLGRWLRVTHLDELPQLFHVICGDMSLIGPRPERPYFAARFAREIPHYEDRHRIRSGLTGWAQVHGLTGDTSIAERARFDNHYIEHWSPWLDVVILARTMAQPLTGMTKERRSRPRA
jgi:exopolysaccharide biosynthesis polyprenyl glycosylphosphotransferase